MKLVSCIVGAVAVLFYISLVTYVVLHGDTLEQSNFATNVVFSALIVCGGPIASFMLNLMGDRANLKFSGKRYAFTVGGGYAVVFVAVLLTKPKVTEVIQLVELHEKTGDIPYSIDLADPVVYGDDVIVEGMSKEKSQKAFLKCRFGPNAKKATIVFTVRANNIPYQGSLDVLRGGRPETVGQYIVKRAL